MPEWLQQSWSLLKGLGPILRISLLLLVGLPLLRLATRMLRRRLLRRGSPQAAMVATKVVFYLGIVLLISVVLQELGFRIGTVLGAAGILGIAIGFASQTSLSNIISGAFLITERPFAVGEVIQIGDVLGTVMSVDLLSVKVRTFDNRLVRFPNEHVIKNVVTTVNRYPIRRLDVKVSVAYKEDVARVRTVLLAVADRNPLCLDEPKPLIIFNNFGDSGLEFTFAVWTLREEFLNLRNSIMDEVKVAFDAEGIEIPFPHLSLYAGSASDPLPIRMVQTAEDSPPPPGS